MRATAAAHFAEIAGIACRLVRNQSGDAVNSRMDLNPHSVPVSRQQVANGLLSLQQLSPHRRFRAEKSFALTRHRS
jgi:hypothetical protein